MKETRYPWNHDKLIKEINEFIDSSDLTIDELIKILETTKFSNKKELYMENNETATNLASDFAEEIKEKIKTLSWENLKTIEKRLRPGNYSMEWFLGKNESLMSLLQSDYEKCKELWINAQGISKELQYIVAHFREWKKEYISWYGEKITIKWYGTRGMQSNPFTTDKSPTSSLNIFISRNNEEIQITEMHSWLISELWFFQWKESAYRVDPEKFAQMIGAI